MWEHLEKFLWGAQNLNLFHLKKEGLKGVRVMAAARSKHLEIINDLLFCAQYQGITLNFNIALQWILIVYCKDL